MFALRQLGYFVLGLVALAVLLEASLLVVLGIDWLTMHLTWPRAILFTIGVLLPIAVNRLGRCLVVWWPDIRGAMRL